MPEPSAQLDEIYRNHSAQVLATLIRLLGSFDLAEEALHDAFVAAAERWSIEGAPENPTAWLVSTGRFKALDQLRRRRRFTAWEDASEFADRLADDPRNDDPDILQDDQLRLIFTCCHPSLAQDAQIALTLREVCGLTTEEIARGFLLSPTALAQRIVRAKAKIREARIPYEIPEANELPERLRSVLRVIYLVFNEGYSASSGDAALRPDLSGEAIRLVRLLATLSAEPEVTGLLALMLLHESRRAARTTKEGDLVLLEEQDRKLWNRTLIEEGCTLVRESLQRSGFGAYTLQAAIVAIHAEARSPEDTDWAEIAGLYDLLLHLEPSPIVELNRAVAIAMRDGPQAGLVLLEPLLNHPTIRNYHLAYAAKADFCRRLGKWSDARLAYQAALDLAQQEPERRFLRRRLAELPA